MPPTTGPRDVGTLPSIPHGRTARRLEWQLLPPMVRRMVAQHFGTDVVRARSAGAGYTPGCASVLTGADGRRLFLKAASKRAQRPFAEAYTQEIRNLRALPPGLPVPRLLWSHEDDLWVVLAMEHVEGAIPRRPWDRAELDLCLDALEDVARRLTPPPMRRMNTFAREFADFPAGWEYVRRTAAEWPHREEAAALAGRWKQATAGDTVVHADARDDNFVVTGDRAYLCDWNLPVVGAAWIDTVCLLVSAFGDGVDADALLSERALTRNVDGEDVDVLLALLCGYFLERRVQPAPYSSPYLRQHQDWYAEVTWAWLARRRGWA